MAKSVWNMPGPGGNLGQCGICGDTFMAEILTGEKCHIVGLEGLEKDFCVHKKCMPIINKVEASGDWHDLPQGPLRRIFEKQNEPDLPYSGSF